MLTGLVKSQTVRVINQTDLQPVENVLVYNLDKTASALSNIKGIVELDEFSDGDTLVFQHPAFSDYFIIYNNIPDINFLIKLKEKSVNLSEVVISASKWEQNIKEVPNKITTILPRQVNFHNPQTAADLLNLSNEVFIQKSQFGGGSPMIRGFSANSVLIVVDGVRMNNAIFRSGNLQNVISIDPNIIESAEVIFGPGSIIYGSDALGGVMDFHTRKVRLGMNDENYISANSLFRYSTASNEKTVHMDINYGSDKWGFITSFTYSDFDDLKMGSHHNSIFKREKYTVREFGHDTTVINDDFNVQKFSGYEYLNFLQKVRYKPNKHYDITYSLIYSNTSDIPRYDRLIQTKDDHFKYAEWYYGPQYWMMNNLNLKLHEVSQLFDNAQILLAFQQFEESRNDRKYKSDYLRERTENINAYSLNIDFDKELNEKHTFFYGFEAVHNTVDSKSMKENIETGKTEATSTRYPDGGSNYSTFAAYLSYKYNLSEKYTLSAGARYSHVLLKSKFKDTTFFKFPFEEIDLSTGALNGSLGLVYRPDEKIQLKLNASSGFRAPNIDDVAKVFDSEPGNVIVPNKNLKPEYAYNIDIGAVKEFGKIAKFDATFFYTFLVDAMVRRESTFNGKDSIIYDGELSQVWSLQNVGHAYIYGGSFSFAMDITPNFAFDTYLTYQKGRDSDDQPLRHVPPLFGSSGITYKAEKIRIKLYSRYNGEISYDDLAESERNKPHLYAKDENGNPYSPAWWTLNLKASYQIIKNIQLNAGIENILDYRFRPYSSGICAPGRNFFITIRVSI